MLGVADGLVHSLLAIEIHLARVLLLDFSHHDQRLRIILINRQHFQPGSHHLVRIVRLLKTLHHTAIQHDAQVAVRKLGRKVIHSFLKLFRSLRLVLDRLICVVFLLRSGLHLPFVRSLRSPRLRLIRRWRALRRGANREHSRYRYDRNCLS